MCIRDRIYSGCLDAFYPSTNPQEFWKSVRKIQSLKISRILPGHHHLSIPVTIIDKIETAFHNLSNEGKLKQGNGIFLSLIHIFSISSRSYWTAILLLKTKGALDL